MLTNYERKLAIYSALGLLGIAGLFFVKSMFITVPSGTVGVKIMFGKYDDQELKAGLHFRIPVAEEIKIVDTKVHSITYKGSMNGGKDGIIYKPAITVLDQRGLPIHVELTVQYRLIPDEASEMLQEWGENWEEKLVNPIAREVVRDVIGDYPAETIPIKRPEIATRIEQGIRNRIKQATINGKVAVEVVGVQLRDIVLPPEIQRKIKEVQLAKQEAEKMKYVEEKAKREQEVKRIQAETKKIEQVTKAQAEAESRLTVAKAIAQANREIAKSITPEILKWKELEVQQKVADSLQKNPNVRLFLNVPTGGNFHMWLNSSNSK